MARRLATRLAALGVHTAGDLRRASRPLIRQRFGVVGERIVLELNGVSCLELEEVEALRQHLCCSRSFGRMVTELEELRQAVTANAERAGEKLRRQGRAASAVACSCKEEMRGAIPAQFARIYGSRLAVTSIMGYFLAVQGKSAILFSWILQAV